MAPLVATEYMRLPAAATAATAANEGCRPAGGGRAPLAGSTGAGAWSWAAVGPIRRRIAARGGGGNMASHVRSTLSKFFRSAGRASQIVQNTCITRKCTHHLRIPGEGEGDGGKGPQQ